MGAPSNGRRALAAFFGLSAGVVLLFGLVAFVALRPTDGLAWVQVPDLAADLRLDAGLQTKPLKNAVVAEALQDQALDASVGDTLAVQPALAVVVPQPVVAVRQPPATRPVTDPTPGPSQPAPQPSPGPVPTATASPTPAPTATPTATPAPSPTPAPTADADADASADANAHTHTSADADAHAPLDPCHHVSTGVSHQGPQERQRER
jgi:outer membrane biosynthesis protein TonB